MKALTRLATTTKDPSIRAAQRALDEATRDGSISPTEAVHQVIPALAATVSSSRFAEVIEAAGPVIAASKMDPVTAENFEHLARLGRSFRIAEELGPVCEPSPPAVDALVGQLKGFLGQSIHELVAGQRLLDSSGFATSLTRYHHRTLGEVLVVSTYDGVVARGEAAEVGPLLRKELVLRSGARLIAQTSSAVIDHITVARPTDDPRVQDVAIEPSTGGGTKISYRLRREAQVIEFTEYRSAKGTVLTQNTRPVPAER